jgi:hypothetical protein
VSFPTNNERSANLTISQAICFCRPTRIAAHGSPFWDVVVLTATDEPQAQSYASQIKVKQGLKEVPASLKFHVFPDPPGPKIGNGGATMHALECLSQVYGDELDNFKVHRVLH